MPILAPAKRINPTIKRRTGFEKKNVYASLLLVSMVDMFAIMVIFLLQSFSAEGELIVLPKGLELPKAENIGVLERAPSLVISQDQILLEGNVIAKTGDVAAQTEWAVLPLQKALSDYRTKSLAEATRKGLTGDAATKFGQKINISADKRLTFQVVKKVIYNAGFAGYPDFRFAVFGGSKPPVRAETLNP
ncbi:MAG: Adventurous gliding motility protein [Bacteriovoracaceae bacterium]|nr:Adventurous gliding motility protein [Bacteriovoracaceae bacterium]